MFSIWLPTWLLDVFLFLLVFCFRVYMFIVEEGDGGGDVGDRRKRYDEESTLPAFCALVRGN